MRVVAILAGILVYYAVLAALAWSQPIERLDGPAELAVELDVAPPSPPAPPPLPPAPPPPMPPCAWSATAPASDPAYLSPGGLAACRIAGETRIVPPDDIKRQIQRDGRTRLLGAFEHCLTTEGNVASVVVKQSTGYPAYDAALVAGMQAWKYIPFIAAGAPRRVCSTVGFLYTQR